MPPSYRRPSQARATPVAPGGLGDGGRHRGPDPRVERRGDDHVLGQVVADQGGQRLGGGQLHALGDRAWRARRTRPRKMPGNASTLLIWLGKSERPVATTRAYLCATSGWTSGVGLARPKMIDSGAIRATSSSGTVPPETPDVDVGAVEHVGQRAGAAGLVGGHLGERALDRRQVAAPGVQDALAVGDREVLDAGVEQDLGDRDAGGAGAGDDHPGRLRVAAGQPERVGERGEGDDRGAVLVVVEDRDVEHRLEPVLDLEAARRGDVLEVDPAEARRQPGDGLDDLLDVGGARQIGTPSTPPNCLNSTALPSITGIAAAGPMSPSPSTAVPSVTTATVLGTHV